MDDNNLILFPLSLSNLNKLIYFFPFYKSLIKLAHLMTSGVSQLFLFLYNEIAEKIIMETKPVPEDYYETLVWTNY